MRVILATTVFAGLTACGSGVDPVTRTFAAGQATANTDATASELRAHVASNGSGGFYFTSSPGAVSDGTGGIGWDGTQVVRLKAPSSFDYDTAGVTFFSPRNGVLSFVRRGLGYMNFTGDGQFQRAMSYWERSGSGWAIGAASIGTRTPDAGNLPATAVYDGGFVGQYIGASGTHYETHGDISMDVDFAGGRFNMRTDPVVNSYQGTTSVAAAGLPFSASGNVNGIAFAGTATANLNNLAGPTSGHFYGPNGEEVGGTFDMEGIVGTHIGAFSMRQ